MRGGLVVKITATADMRGWRARPWRDRSYQASPAEEADSVRPVPSSRCLEQAMQCLCQPPNVRWCDGLFVDENYATVAASGLRPNLKQRRDGSTVVGDECQSLAGSFQKTGVIVQPEKVALLPICHGMNH